MTIIERERKLNTFSKIPFYSSLAVTGAGVLNGIFSGDCDLFFLGLISSCVTWSGREMFKAGSVLVPYSEALRYGVDKYPYATRCVGLDGYVPVSRSRLYEDFDDPEI